MAQLALNALKTPVVEAVDGTTNITTTVGGATTQVVTGSVNYKVTASSDAYARAISAVEGSDQTTVNGISGYVIELGEKLYDGKLQLRENGVNGNVVYDDFGRPARRWQYDGKTFGTYTKVEDLRQEYTTKVTGKMLYDELGSDIVTSIEKGEQWKLNVTIDGETQYADLSPYGNAYFSINSIKRTNTDKVGETGNGVLTQVYVDSVYHIVDIAVINTYLAIAEQDYNSKDEDVDLRVYHISDDKGTANDKTYVKFNHETQNSEEIITVNGEDFDIVNVKEDDKFLVTVAKGEIQTMAAPEVVSETTLNTFKQGDWVKNDDAQYDYADTARYDVEVLDQYDQANMKDVTYNVVLDQYGYLIGIELNEQANQYLFLAGMDLGNSNLSAKNATANVIFLDGTMKTVTVKVDKSQIAAQPKGTSGSTKPYTVTGGKDDISTIAPAAAWSVAGSLYADGTSDGTTAIAPPANADAAPSMSQINTWCTYSVDGDGVYTLKQVGEYSMARKDTDPVKGAKKIAQSSMDMNDLAINTENPKELVISSKNVTLEGSKAKNDATYGDFTYVYGNEDTVYINTSLKKVTAKDDSSRAIIDKIDSVTTGVKNVDMTVKNLKSTASGLSNSIVPKAEVYVLYGDDGYVIGVVTLGADDNGSTSKWAYITGEVNEEGYLGNNQWKWSKNAIIDGQKVVLTEVDDTLDILSNNKTARGKWYSLRFDSDGNVIGIKEENTGDAPANSEDEIKFDFKSNGVDKDNDKFVESVNDAYKAWNKISPFTEKFSTVLLRAVYTDHNTIFSDTATAKREMKFERGTLYTDRNAVANPNGLNEGFQISQTANIVLITSKGHNTDIWNNVLDGYTGWDGMEQAIKDLNSTTTDGWSSFDGILMAVFKDGVATSIILQDMSGNGKRPITESGNPMTIDIEVVDDAGNSLRTIKNYKWNGTDTLASIVGTISGYTAGAETTPTFHEGGTGNAQIVYNRNKTMQVLVQYHTGSASGPVVATEVKNVTTDVKNDGVLNISTAANPNADLVLEAPGNFVFDGAAQTFTDFFEAGGKKTIDVVVKNAVTIYVKVMGDEGVETVTKKVASDAKYADQITSTNANEWFQVSIPGDPNPTIKYVNSTSTAAGDVVASGATIDTTKTFVKVKVDITETNDCQETENAGLGAFTAAIHDVATMDKADSNANVFLQVGETYQIDLTMANAAQTTTNATKGVTVKVEADANIETGAETATELYAAGATVAATDASKNVSITVAVKAAGVNGVSTLTVTLADGT